MDSVTGQAIGQQRQISAGRQHHVLREDILRRPRWIVGQAVAFQVDAGGSRVVQLDQIRIRAEVIVCLLVVRQDLVNQQTNRLLLYGPRLRHGRDRLPIAGEITSNHLDRIITIGQAAELNRARALSALRIEAGAQGNRI